MLESIGEDGNKNSSELLGIFKIDVHAYTLILYCTAFVNVFLFVLAALLEFCLWTSKCVFLTFPLRMQQAFTCAFKTCTEPNHDNGPLKVLHPVYCKVRTLQ